MKSKLLVIVLFLFSAFQSTAQWLQRANFPGTSRSRSTAFTIGSKIYVVGGYAFNGAVLNDFWEYDIAANTWLQKQNFPGPERFGAASFVINNKGYIATGANDFGDLDDTWEYDPVANTWIQKTGLPAGSAQHENQRSEAFALAIGNKGYLGGGSGWVFGANSTTNYAFSDLWEFDPSLNTWTHISDFPDFFGRNMSIGVAFNNKAYIGLGCNIDQTMGWQSLWEYDPVANNWTALSNSPSIFDTDAGAFVLDSDIYIVGGVKFNPVTLTNQVYKYNIPSDTWSALPNFNGGAVAGEFAISSGSKAFTGTGFNSALNTRNDLWEYTSVATGVENISSQANGVYVYPNPFSSNEFTIAMNFRNSNQYHITLRDLEGRIILQRDMIPQNGKMEIAAEGIAKGVYVATLMNESEDVSIKVLKN